MKLLVNRVELWYNRVTVEKGVMYMSAYVELMTSTGIYPSARGAKMCYGDPAAVNAMGVGEQVDFLKRLIKLEHESVLEHTVFVFELHNVSRACLQELARHRHISLSVKSTRWAMKKHTKFHVPSSMNENVKKTYCDYMEHNLNIADIVRSDCGNDIAKYYLPEGIVTELVLTVNLRELRHMYKVRTSNKALLEFQELMHSIVSALPVQEQELVKYNPQQERLDLLEHHIRFLQERLLNIYKQMEYDSHTDRWSLIPTEKCLHVCNGIADYLEKNGVLTSAEFDDQDGFDEHDYSNQK